MEMLMKFHVHLLHPRIIHFPIALFIGAMGMEVLSLIFRRDSFHRTALHIYILAALITPLVALTGLQEAEHMHLDHPVLTLHKRFALLTMWSAILSLPVLWFTHRRSIKLYRTIFLIFTLLIALFVTMAGYNGGRMVYEYGVGVEQ